MKHLPASPATLLGLSAVALLLAPSIGRAQDATPSPAPPAGGTTQGGPPAPAGMLWVDLGGAKIGTPAEEVLRLAGKRKDLLRILMYETPVHDPKLVPYFIDKYEVTNAQYLKFLEDTGRATTFKTGSAALANLEEVAKYFAYEGRDTVASRDDKWSWGQVYELNKVALQAALPDLLVDEKDKQRKLGDKEAKQRFRLAALPPDVELKVYRWRLPRTWFQTSDKLEGNGAPDHPVRDVTYLEAEAFAEWAGKHVMTEAEYEWAARGPDGRVYPWGNDWAAGVDEAGNKIVEKRCNWSETKVLDKDFQPTTVAVTALPEGQSWCGAFHLLGNVAEWTSSWFDPYPGYAAADETTNPWTSYYGDFVHVIRGGSCADSERLALRCAYRNFVGIERLKPPKPDHSYEFVGFRCAQYLTPGRDRVQSLVERVLRPKKVRADEFATDRFAGSVATHFAPSDAAVENAVYVTGRARAVVVVPVKRLFPEDRKPGARTRDDLLRLEPGTLEPAEEAVVLAAFQTDLPLKVKVRDPKAAVPEAPGSGRRERHKETAKPALIDGVLEPDTYLLGIAGGQIGVYRANLDFVAALDVKPKDVAGRKLKKDEAFPATAVSVDKDLGGVRVTFYVPFGGKGMTDQEGVTVDFFQPCEEGVIEKAGNWR